MPGVDEDELAREQLRPRAAAGWMAYLIGSVEPIDGIEEAPALETPGCEMNLTRSDVINGDISGDGVTLIDRRRR